MDDFVLAGFADELAKNAGAMGKVWGAMTKKRKMPGTGVAKKLLGVGALGAAGTIAVGELASRQGHEEKQRYRKRLAGQRTRSHLYGDPARYG